MAAVPGWTRRLLGRRAPTSLALGALLALLVGDHAYMQVTGGGIDPLEVLKLTVKPNVIVVLDSSGSMRESPDGSVTFPRLGGDWPGSKLYQAKQVLKQVIQANQDKVSFMFGQYTQSGSDLNGDTPGNDRFFYSTTDGNASGLTVVRSNSSGGDTTSRGFQNWQDIRSGWNTLYYGEQTTITTTTPPSIVIDSTNNLFVWRERISTSPYRFITCSVTLANGTYSTDAEINTFLATLNPLLASGSVAGRTCTRSGGSGSSDPTIGLSVAWLGAPAFQFRIDKTTGSNRLQIVRNPTANVILDDLGYTNAQALTMANGCTVSISNDGGSGCYTTGTSFTSSAVGGTSSSSSVVVCAQPVPAAFYRDATLLATALQTAMNACPGRGLTPNTYSVTWSSSTGAFTFSRSSGSNNFQMRWGDTPNNIAGALGSPGTANTGLSTSAKSSGSSDLALRRFSGDAGAGYFWLRAGRFFNGETYQVTNTGTFCGPSTDAVTPMNPPQVTIRLLPTSSCPAAASNAGTPIVFTYAGGTFGGNGISCNGYQTRVNLVACDMTSGQGAVITPLLDLETPLAADGLTIQGYTESQDGSFNTTSLPSQGGVIADGATPIANSLRDIKTLFNTLWTSGQNPGPPVLTAISTHSNPKERTIVMFVTDGDDTCSGSGSTAALTAAYRGQLLYAPLVGTVQSPSGFLSANADPASSVSTYVVGFGSGASTNFLNWIAWGGSGMTRANDGVRWTSQPTSGDRANCKTCIDAFIAPDAATLTAALQAIIDQGANSGAFTAQQSITAAVYELAGEITGFSPDDPRKRYDALVPNQFQASFVLPGFQGQLKAIQNDSGTAFTKWEAGAKLLTRVQNGMNSISPLRTGASAGQGTFSQLHNGATDVNVTTAKIPRRIYTTSRNGTFTLAGPTLSALSASPIYNANLANLLAGNSPGRERLWPPTTSATSSNVAPASDTVQGLLDAALGLPTDAQITAGAAAQFTALQTTFRACRGLTLPTNCQAAAGSTNQAMRARREAREMILSFMAGAEFVPDVNGNPARITAAGGSDVVGDILYQARAWVLAESTLAPPAIIEPPIGIRPVNYGPEYDYYISSPKSAGIAQNGLAQGFGLRYPEGAPTTFDVSTPTSGNDTRTTLKPVMTVAALGANDMLHMFRAGPSCRTPGGTGAAATYAGCSADPGPGGDELWGFVPYDRLIALKDIMQPQTRANKTYIIAASMRFADVFVDAPGGAATISVGTAALTSPVPRGVWRQILFFGRGRGGRYMTALDVTGRGAYTTAALSTQPPIVLWSRGNPDTDNGANATSDTPAGTGIVVNTTADYNAYKKMGETWSVPAIAFVPRPNNVTTRRPYPGVSGDAGGVPFVAYMGSGYGAAGEGTTFYTLDATTGDVVAAVDVEAAAVAAGVQRTGLPYANAVVASPAAFSASQLVSGTPAHPADPTTKVFVGDLHGRLWKFLSSSPSTPLLMADVGADQPLGTAPALLAIAQKPYVFVTSGNDSRAPDTTNFKYFGFRDDGDDTTATYSASPTSTTDPGVKVYSPAAYLFSDVLGTKFRGTLQPATALSSANNGRVFFGGTRFNDPGTAFAPPPYPCRSSFDSVIFALGAETGQAAYDLSGSGDDRFLVFSNSRKTALQIIKEPTPPGAPPGTQGKGQLVIDEGLLGGTSVTPPPPPGIQPQIPGPPTVGLANPTTQDPRQFPQFTTPRLCQ